MNVSGLLALFDHIPTWPSVVERGESADVDPTALHLPRSARAPVLARLAQERRGPLLFVTGRVDAVPHLAADIRSVVAGRCPVAALSGADAIAL